MLLLPQPAFAMFPSLCHETQNEALNLASARMLGPRIAMQRAHEGRAAPGPAAGDGLESDLLQITSGSCWDGPAYSSSDSTIECNCPWLKIIISSTGTSKPGSATQVPEDLSQPLPSCARVSYACSQKHGSSFLFDLSQFPATRCHFAFICTQKNPQVSHIFSSGASPK